MDDDVFGTPDRLKGAADQMLPGLDEDLDGHVVRDMAAFDQLAADSILRFGGGGKPHLDLLKAHIAESLKEFELFLHIHRIHQRLIAVPQVNAAPYRRFFDHPVRPLPVGQPDRREGSVFLKLGFHLGHPPL